MLLILKIIKIFKKCYHFLNILNILKIFNINNIDKEINKKLPEDDLIEDRNMLEWFLKCFMWF
jgi:hypothetical protein